ncbi:MAG: hypothetical protein Q9217_001626 [Psora testacea]
MSSNVGLSTPRGSGTSGYVQRNLSHLKPRDNFAPYPKDYDQLRHKQRKPDQQILNHDRMREIEVKVFELRDKLEDDGVEEEEIETQTEDLRAKLMKGDRDGKGDKGEGKKEGRERQFKPHQVHEQAEAKIVESERLRRALRINKDYEEGSHWRRDELNSV